MTSPFDNKNAMCLVELRDKFRRKAEDLKERCLRLSARLERVATECDQAREDRPYSINALGEVQGYGLEIDRACAELKMLDEMRAMARWLNAPEANATASETRMVKKARK